MDYLNDFYIGLYFCYKFFAFEVVFVYDLIGIKGLLKGIGFYFLMWYIRIEVIGYILKVIILRDYYVLKDI